MKVLVADGLAAEGIDRLRRAPDVEVVSPADQDALRAALADADAVIVRSRTRVDEKTLAGAHRLRVIARAGVGIDNIDVQGATRRGILVLNAPESSTVSTAEHTMAMLLALSRAIPAAHQALAAGSWQRERFTGIELYGKTLGVVGLGRIGAAVAQRAAAFGMRVIACDPYVSAERAGRVGAALVSWEDLLAESDIVTLHLPLTPATHHVLGAAEFRRMRRGVRVVNCARGGLVDEAALLEALEEEQVSGAALDVFEREPPDPSGLPAHPRVVVTPHLGASTDEAQRTIAVEVADQVLAALAGLPVRGAVNAPALREEHWRRLQPFADLMRALGGVARQLARGQVGGVEFLYEGEVATEETSTLSAAFLTGLLEAVSDQPVNLVNAALLARERGIGLSEARREQGEDFSSLIQVRLDTAAGPLLLGGTLFGSREPRITHLDGYRIDLPPAPHMLFVWNADRPGMIGSVGTILGRHHVNIAGMQVGRDVSGGTAVMVLTVDSPVPAAAVDEIAGVDGISAITTVTLSP